MNRGTRRMWSRRVLRAGWALAPVLRFPAAAWEFLFGDSDRRFWTILVMICGSLVTSCTVWDQKLSAMATPEQITEYLKDDHCMIEMMPRWQVNVKRPLNYSDLLQGKKKCNEYWADRREIAKQKKIMEALK